jgi:hypothetical protein
MMRQDCLLNLKIIITTVLHGRRGVPPRQFLLVFYYKPTKATPSALVYFYSSFFGVNRELYYSTAQELQSPQGFELKKEGTSTTTTLVTPY